MVERAAAAIQRDFAVLRYAGKRLFHGLDTSWLGTRACKYSAGNVRRFVQNRKTDIEDQRLLTVLQVLSKITRLADFGFGPRLACAQNGSDAGHRPEEMSTHHEHHVI